MAIYKKTAGFSLIEVNMAILIAAGGLLALFALFPSGLRQSVMAQADMYQCMFANSFFETVAGNVQKIESVDDWNDLDKFWTAAIAGTGIKTTSSGLKELDQANSDSNLSEATKELFLDDDDKVFDKNKVENIRYVYRESDEAGTIGSGTLLLPPQFIIRIVQIVNETDPPGDQYFPNRYAISLVSSDQFAPAIFHRNAVYQSEFYFNKRP